MSFRASSITLRLASLEKEIHRFEQAQDRMGRTNTALILGDIDTLQKLGLPQELIDELQERHACGLPGYPSSVFKHNNEYLRFLKLKRRKLVKFLSYIYSKNKVFKIKKIDLLENLKGNC
jgi:hypothetical protein